MLRNEALWIGIKNGVRSASHEKKTGGAGPKVVYDDWGPRLRIQMPVKGIQEGPIEIR